jgi:hypothetical protein
MKFFIFKFKERGFNSVWANSREEVVPKYTRMNGYTHTIDETTIRELNEEETKAYWETFKNEDRTKWGKIGDDQP